MKSNTIHKLARATRRHRISACGLRALGNAAGIKKGPFVSAFMRPTCKRCRRAKT